MFKKNMRVICIAPFEQNYSIIGKEGYIYAINPLNKDNLGVCFDDMFQRGHGFAIEKSSFSIEEIEVSRNRCWDFINPKKYLCPIDSIEIL